MEIVTAHGKLQVSEQPFWHLAGDPFITINNLRVGKGCIASISMTGINGAVTPYSWHAMQDRKEQVFEQVRQGIYPTLPSRMAGCLYLFHDRELAERKRREWFGREDRLLLECRLTDLAVAHTADAYWLDDSRGEMWTENANRYWRGELSASRSSEVLVHGIVYVPEWELLPWPLIPGTRHQEAWITAALSHVQEPTFTVS